MKVGNYYINQSSGDGSWSDLLGDVYSGITLGMGHTKTFVGMTVHNGMDAIASMITRRVGNDTEGGRPHVTAGGDDGGTKRGLRVVGVGYGRTGTFSLAIALDELGYPTLHTQHLHENTKLFNHLHSNIFYKSIQEDEIIKGQPDFNLILEAGYTATMDLPFALYYDHIMELYPDCKFILTVRENSDVWFRSWDVLANSIIQPAMFTSQWVTYMKKLENYMRSAC
ncbi:hypothetical protein ACHAXA_009485 [Cyclostephanos tholiformis]|uniref:Uncharacterized protein n=1 Tax=Cyclostephanos tholiformis TaxID=382380 RepID=A0ABD3RBS5_9STRA